MTLLPLRAFTNLGHREAEGLEGLTEMGTLGTKLAPLLFLCEAKPVSNGEAPLLSKGPVSQLRKMHAVLPLGFVRKEHSVAYSLEFSRHHILLRAPPAVRAKE